MEYLSLPILLGIKIGGTTALSIFVFQSRVWRISKPWQKNVLGFTFVCLPLVYLSLYIYALTSFVSMIDRMPFAATTFSVAVLSGFGVHFFYRWFFNTRWGKEMMAKGRARTIRRIAQKKSKSVAV